MHLIPGLRERVVDSQTPALHRSALVHRTVRPKQLGGTLCPNAVTADGRRVDDVLGREFAVITDRALTPAQDAALRNWGAAILVAEPQSALAAWLRAGHAHAAAVRPDRTVLKAALDIDEVCQALSEVLLGR